MLFGFLVADADHLDAEAVVFGGGFVLFEGLFGGVFEFQHCLFLGSGGDERRIIFFRLFFQGIFDRRLICYVLLDRLYFSLW